MEGRTMKVTATAMTQRGMTIMKVNDTEVVRNRYNTTARLVVAALCMSGAAGCGSLDDEAVDGLTETTTDQELYSPTGTRYWPNGDVKVCFLASAFSTDPVVGPQLTAWRTNVQNWVTAQIEPFADLEFSGFGACTANPGQTWLKINVVSTSNSNALAIGYVADNQINFGGDRTIQGVVLHEFMHKLGFGHEFNRLDSDGCFPAQGGATRTGTYWTSYDPASIMNSTYCHSNAVLSAKDRAGLNAAYGGAAMIARHGVSASSYQTIFSDIAAAGYRPIWVDGYEVGGNNFFNVLFVPANFAWVARHHMTGAQYQAEFNTHVGHGLRLSQVDSYLVGGEVRYAAIWDGTPSTAWTAYHGVSQATHQANFNSLTAQGFRPVNISAVRAGGTRVFTALYDKAAVGSFFTLTGMTEAEYQTQFNANTAAGRRLAYVNAFMESGVPKISAIWDQKNTGSWVARHGQSSAQYQAEFDLRVSQGLLPRRVAGYESGGSARFASLFTQF